MIHLGGDLHWMCRDDCVGWRPFASGRFVEPATTWLVSDWGMGLANGIAIAFRLRFNGGPTCGEDQRPLLTSISIQVNLATGWRWRPVQVASHSKCHRPWPIKRGSVANEVDAKWHCFHWWRTTQFNGVWQATQRPLVDTDAHTGGWWLHNGWQRHVKRFDSWPRHRLAEERRRKNQLPIQLASTTAAKHPTDAHPIRPVNSARHKFHMIPANDIHPLATMMETSSCQSNFAFAKGNWDGGRLGRFVAHQRAAIGAPSVPPTNFLHSQLPIDFQNKFFQNFIPDIFRFISSYNCGMSSTYFGTL